MVSVLSIPSAVSYAGDSLDGWQSKDIGSIKMKTEAEFKDGVFTVKASGTDVWVQEDGFNFIYKTLSGDGEITAKVESFIFADAWTKVGIMMRESTSAEARNAFLLMAPPGTMLQYRLATCSHEVNGHTTAVYSNVSVKQGTFDVKVSGKADFGGVIPVEGKPPVINREIAAAPYTGLTEK